MADLPLPELAQLRERVRDLEEEVQRLRRGGAAASGTAGSRDDELIESEERFRVAFETAPAGISITRVTDGKVLYVNPTFCRDIGRSIDEVVGQTMEAIDLYADEDERQRLFTKLIENGYVDGVEFRYRTIKGEVRTGLLSSRPITLRGELCQLGMAFDITDAKRAQADRARLEEQLAQSQKMEAIGRLAAGVAHDFNNLLTAIVANVELGLMQAAAGDPLRLHLLEIREATARAAGLTGQLLAFSRKQVLEPCPVDLSAKVDEMRTMLGRVVGEGVSLSFDLAPGLPPVLVDPTQLEQVVLNLVVNARDAAAPNGLISVATRLAELQGTEGAGRSGTRFVVLAVADDGKGIPADVVPHVFEPFFSTKGERGTGLGLSTVDGIVTQHGGFVELDTKPGRGTTFRVFLPEAPEGAARPQQSRPPAPNEKQQGVLLLVEDDASVREPTAALLRRLGFTVHTAATTTIALELARAHRDLLEILLTDMVMPLMSGSALAAAVKQLVPGIAVVTMSGYPEDVIERGGVLDPGVVLVRKPFGAEQLAAAIARARAHQLDRGVRKGDAGGGDAQGQGL
ncbi:MAG: PAS domain S-box protein [Myxococcales bacterium]|nr:PAS domain S-box protein [Myxococcales bacterium]